MSLPSPLLGLALLAAVILVGWATLRLRRWWAGRRLQGKMRRARGLEASAEKLLAREGYTVIDAQVPGRWRLVCDGEPLEGDVRADYLVRRGDRVYVAEAKSGPRATNPADRATRRQLLDYAASYDVDGVLLVDTEAGRVFLVEFPQLGGASPEPGRDWRALAIAFGLGVVATLVALASR